MDMKGVFAKRVTELRASEIREMFKLMGNSNIISLAGGSPAVESFPNRELAKIAADLLAEKPEISLQYSVTEGYTPLRDIMKERMKKIDNYKPWDDLIMTTGGQQAIDLVMRVLVDDGQGIIVEQPSFIGTLNGARSYNAVLYGVPVLEDGLDLEKTEQLLKEKNIKMIYTIPTFQNPTGITMTLEKRKALLRLAQKYNVFILEDNPYGELRFKGEPVPTIKSLDEEGRVIYVGSLSKVLSAGLRIGWVDAHADIIDRVVVVKQVNDVHTPILNQMMAAEYMKQYSLDEHIAQIQVMYRRKCEKMLSCMDKYFPDYCTYTRPEGGLFLFCTLPEGTNTAQMLKVATARGVAFVPGHTCMVDIGTPTNTFRLNYSMAPEDKIEEAIKILADVIREFVGKE